MNLRYKGMKIDIIQIRNARIYLLGKYILFQLWYISKTKKVKYIRDTFRISDLMKVQ